MWINALYFTTFRLLNKNSRTCHCKAWESKGNFSKSKGRIFSGIVIALFISLLCIALLDFDLVLLPFCGCFPA